MRKKLSNADRWPTLVQERLVEWGRCVNVQRQQQRITAADLCRRLGISEATLRRLERGDPGVGAGAYLNALLTWARPQRLAPRAGVRRRAESGGTPRRLVMQLSRGRFDIARDAVLDDAVRFGFSGRDACAAYLDTLLARIDAAFPPAAAWLTEDWRATLQARMTENPALLRGR